MNLQIHKNFDVEICRGSKEHPQPGSGLGNNRHFYVYTPPRPLDQIERKITTPERYMAKLLKEVVV